MVSRYQPGRKIGRFELIRVLDTIGDREIWLGSRSAFGALELARLDLPAGGAALAATTDESFGKEIDLAPRLRHSCIAGILDSGQVEGRTFIAREFLDATLADVLATLELLRFEDESRRLACIARIIQGVLEALSHAHGVRAPGQPLGIAHGHLDASSVLLSRRGEVKVAGFGIDRRRGDGTAGLVAFEGLRSMAPEQLHGRGLMPSADLYAAGFLLHTLLDGQPAWAELDGEALYRAILSGTPPPLLQPAPAELLALHAALVASDLRQRAPSAKVALDLLARWPCPVGDPTKELAVLVGRALAPATSRNAFDELSTASSVAPASSSVAPGSVPPPSLSSLPLPSLEEEEGTVAFDDAALARMRAETQRSHAAAFTPAASPSANVASPADRSPAMIQASPQGPRPTSNLPSAVELPPRPSDVRSPQQPASWQASPTGPRPETHTGDSAGPRAVMNSPVVAGAGVARGPGNPAGSRPTTGGPSPALARPVVNVPHVQARPAASALGNVGAPRHVLPSSPAAMPSMVGAASSPHDEQTSTAVLDARHRRKLLVILVAGIVAAVTLGVIVGVVLTSA